MSTKKVPLHEATPAQLRYYADTILGIADIKPQHQAANIIGKIMAVNPEITEIEVPEDVREHHEGAAAEIAPASDDAPSDHFSHDPRVIVVFSRTSDVTKTKRVQLACNGLTVVADRGVPVKLPYRFYLVNLDATETIGRETDEVNGAGMPVMEFGDQPSYPMERVELPPAKDIIAWHKREGSRVHPEVARALGLAA